MITLEQAESQVLEKEGLQKLVSKWEKEIDTLLFTMVELDESEVIAVLPEDVHPLVKKAIIAMYMPHWRLSIHANIKNGLIFRRK